MTAKWSDDLEFQPISPSLSSDFFMGYRTGVSIPNVKYTMTNVATQLNSRINLQSINQVVGLASGMWTPTLVSISGISGSVTLAKAAYTRVGQILTASLDVSFTASDSVNQFSVTLPVTPNFSTNTQTILMGGVLTTSSPNVSDGNLINAVSNFSNQTVTISSNSTVGTGTKLLRVSFMSLLQ